MSYIFIVEKKLLAFAVLASTESRQNQIFEYIGLEPGEAKLYVELELGDLTHWDGELKVSVGKYKWRQL